MTQRLLRLFTCSVVGSLIFALSLPNADPRSAEAWRPPAPISLLSLSKTFPFCRGRRCLPGRPSSDECGAATAASVSGTCRRSSGDRLIPPSRSLLINESGKDGAPDASVAKDNSSEASEDAFEESAELNPVWEPSDLPGDDEAFLTTAVRVLCEHKVEDVFAFVRSPEFRRAEQQVEQELLLLGQRGFARGPRQRRRLKGKRLAEHEKKKRQNAKKHSDSARSLLAAQPVSRLASSASIAPPSAAARPSSPLATVLGLDSAGKALTAENAWFPLLKGEEEAAGGDWRKRVLLTSPHEVFLISTGMSPVHLDSVADAVIKARRASLSLSLRIST